MKKKNRSQIHSFLIFVLLLLVLTGCPPPADPPVLPTLTTTIAGSITSSSATSGGNISIDGGATITARGVCWGTSSGPAITNSKSTDGSGIGTFSSSITGLNPGVIYYVRAYATNSAGTSYGNEISFTTPAILSTITTSAINAITSSSAISGGNITMDGGGAITARGVCWGTASGPTTANSKTTNGSGIGSFSSMLTSLTAGETYFVRAYATNSAGTAYGAEISFTTLANLPTITTTAASAITAVSATSGGNILANGGATVTARGVCWNTSTEPTISNSKTSDGGGNGNFVSSLTALIGNTTYFVRAYATNSAGTAYGTEISFRTSAYPPTVSTAAITSITSTTAISGGNVSSDGGATITSRGVCWSTSPAPTIMNSKTSDGTGTGNFTSTLVLLNAGTTYYVRSYAHNISGTTYGNEISFTTTSSNALLFNPNLTYGTLADIEGNVYKTIPIGSQVWMAENLKTTKLNDGTAIPLITDNNVWNNLSTSGYSWYNNDSTSNKNIYGALYNGYTVKTGKLCPTGWHVPTDAEWLILTTYLGGESVAGDKLKEIGTTHWSSSNAGVTNITGFTAVPGGLRGYGPFYSKGDYGCWWTTSEINTDYSLYRYMNYGDKSVMKNNYMMRTGLSVRCLRD